MNDLDMRSLCRDARKPDRDIHPQGIRAYAAAPCRHTALGDSLITAKIFTRLIHAKFNPLNFTIRTLGGTVAFGRRAETFVKRQQQSGWFDEPSD